MNFAEKLGALKAMDNELVQLQALFNDKHIQVENFRKEIQSECGHDAIHILNNKCVICGFELEVLENED